MRCTGPAYGCPWAALQTPPQRCLRVRPAEEAGPTLPYVSAPVLSRRARIAGYVALTKPRIIELLLITTVPTMIVAERGLPSDRKSVVQGKSVSVRVDFGGRRLIKKTNKKLTS